MKVGGAATGLECRITHVLGGQCVKVDVVPVLVCNSVVLLW